MKRTTKNDSGRKTHDTPLNSRHDIMDVGGSRTVMNG